VPRGRRRESVSSIDNAAQAVSRMHIFDARVRGRVERGLEVQKLEDNARQTLVPDTPVQVESPTTPPACTVR
jgi:hypothetical protein